RAGVVRVRGAARPPSFRARVCITRILPGALGRAVAAPPPGGDRGRLAHPSGAQALPDAALLLRASAVATLAPATMKKIVPPVEQWGACLRPWAVLGWSP